MSEDLTPEYLATVAQAVRDFRAALRSYLELFEFNEGMARGLAPAIFPKTKSQPAEIERRADDLAEASGRAGVATELTHTYYNVQGIGRVDPIAAWSSMARPKPILEPNDILSACGQMLGRLEALATKTRMAQRTTNSATGDRRVVGERAGKPRVFVGSSSEGLEIANNLQVVLDHDCEIEIWSQGLFEPGGSTLASLVRQAPEFDFAILLVTPDDTTVTRGEKRSATRDNVIFELGLFMGVLGSDRTFMLYDRDKRPDLPTDLAGVTPVTYSIHSSGNLISSLGAPGTRFRTAMKQLGRRLDETSFVQAFEDAINEVDEKPVEPKQVIADAVIADYANGVQPAKLAEKYGASPQWITQILKDVKAERQGATRRTEDRGESEMNYSTKPMLSPAQINDFRARFGEREFAAILDYASGDKTVRGVATDQGMTQAHVSDILHKAGFSINNQP